MRTFSHKIFLIFISTLLLTACKSDDSGDAMEDPLSENDKNLGASAEDILSNDIYKSLTVEFAFAEDYRPSEESMTNLRNFISERANKPQGVNFVETVVANQPNGPFSIEEIREIEGRIRTKFTEGDNIAVYIFFSNDSSTNDTQTTVTLGTAYRNTSIVIYERTLQVITDSDPLLLPLLESATLNHEFGHILGLVNITGDDIHDKHEDVNNAKHCFVEDCLMYFDATNVTRQSLSRMMNRMEVPQLDPLCIGDLRAKGGL